MWGDFEAKNALLEDLVFKYAVSLDDKEQEIRRLKDKIRKLEYEVKYEQAHSQRFLITREPEVLAQAQDTSITITKPVATVSLDDNPYDGCYHVIAKFTDDTAVVYKYYITKEAILTAKDKIGILSFLHKRALEELVKKLEQIGDMV